MDKITVSSGNKKMGMIPSISLPPIVTCRSDAPCKDKCYAYRYCKFRPSVKEAYAKNLSIYKKDPDAFFKQLEAALCTNRWFRLHVSGDFPDTYYFARCVEAVRRNPGCTVLAFTKQYELVNCYIAEGGVIPDNFKIVFSMWGMWHPDNPYGLPVAGVIFKGVKDIPDEWKMCGGNCFECACRGVGCWELKKGETIAFHEH